MNDRKSHSDNDRKQIEQAEYRASRLAIIAMLARELYNRGFGISSVDDYGFTVYLNRQITKMEVEMALPDEAERFVTCKQVDGRVYVAFTE